MNKKKDSISVSCSSIADYWCNKAIDSDGNVVIIEDFSELKENEKLIMRIDITEPHCWACGKRFESNSKRSKSLLDRYNYAKGLNRCHIKAQQFGGNNNVDNLFIMCENCHKESPDTLNRKAFFRWVYDQKANYVDGLRIYGLMNDVKEEMTRRGLDFEKINKIAKDLFTDDDTQDVKNRIVELYGENVGLHGFYISRATSKIAATDILLKLIFDKMIKCGFDYEAEAKL